MKAIRGLVQDYIGVNGPAFCDNCGMNDLNYKEIFYHCVPCQYDLCRECALLKAKVIKENDTVAIHNCELHLHNG